jgi:hypothetical protein
LRDLPAAVFGFAPGAADAGSRRGKESASCRWLISWLFFSGFKPPLAS